MKIKKPLTRHLYNKEINDLNLQIVQLEIEVAALQEKLDWYEHNSFWNKLKRLFRY